VAVQAFSPAQIVGYVAFVLGLLAFSQSNDRRLKLLNSCQSLVYALHFLLLGNIPASATSLVASIRSFLATKTRSYVVMAILLIVNLASGFAFAHTPAGWIPVAGSFFGTLAIFLLSGIRMRLVLLACTFCWLTNNILSGSIGGTLLETLVALMNTKTIVRIWLRQRRAVAQANFDSLPSVSSSH